MASSTERITAATIAEHQATRWAKEFDPRDPSTSLEEARAAFAILIRGVYVDLAASCREAAEQRWGRREFPDEGNLSVTARDYGFAVETAQKALAKARRIASGVATPVDPAIPSDFSAPPIDVTAGMDPAATGSLVSDYTARAFNKTPRNGLEADAERLKKYAPTPSDAPEGAAAPFDLRGIAWLDLASKKTGRCRGMKLSKTGFRLPLEFRDGASWLRAAISKGGGFKDGVLVLQFQESAPIPAGVDWIKRQPNDTIWNSRALSDELAKNGWKLGIQYRIEERANCWLVTKEAI